MYRYDEFDHEFVKARVAQFRDQVERRLAGEITEDQFRPLRLMNGVYLQLHAYMLRISIPYGTLSSSQLRMLGHIARTYDKGYGHFTTRQNIQFNWPALSDIPAILDDLASVEMHAIQSSGNCIRNVTADHLAGAAADEAADPRPYAEILRQWSSVHPEFSYLPRKFKIALTGAERDRAAIQTHDIGLHLKRGPDGGMGFTVYVGGGQGRTPIIAKKVREFLPEQDLLLGELTLSQVQLIVDPLPRCSIGSELVDPYVGVLLEEGPQPRIGPRPALDPLALGLPSAALPPQPRREGGHRPSEQPGDKSERVGRAHGRRPKAC